MTGTSTGRLMLAVLSGLADVERDLIPGWRKRTQNLVRLRALRLAKPLADRVKSRIERIPVQRMTR